MKRLIRKELEKISGVSARTIQYYTDRKILFPDVAAPVGRGTTREYSTRNLFELLLIRELSDNKVSLENIQHIMVQLRTSHIDRYWNTKKDAPKTFRLVIFEPHKKGLRLRWYPGSGSVTMPEHRGSALIINGEALVKDFQRMTER